MNLHFGNYAIRDWQTEDAPAIAKHANNWNIWLHLRDSFPHPYRLSDAEAFLSRVMQQQHRTTFAITDSHEAIGSIGLILGDDVHRWTAELGYWLAEPFWNQGIMTQAIKLFTDFAFEGFSLTRIFAVPYAENSASHRVLEKAGFQKEGIFHASAFKDGKILDQYLYAKVRRIIPVTRK